MGTTHGVTNYSRIERGDSGNHNRAVRFDYTDGYLGITSYEDNGDGRVDDRVLLSPKQFEALVAFVAAPKRRRI